MGKVEACTLGHGRRGRLPDMEVLNIDVLVWGCLSLAPEEEPFLGRGLCKTHKDSETGSNISLGNSAQAGRRLSA
jgi:hypothetical protein